MFGDRGIGNLSSDCLQGSKGPDFVDSHQVGVTGDISRQHCRQSPLDAFARHEVPRQKIPGTGLSKHRVEIPASLVAKVTNGSLVENLTSPTLSLGYPQNRTSKGSWRWSAKGHLLTHAALIVSALEHGATGMKRRDFIGLSGAALASWPVMISAAPLKKNYRIGYLALSDRVPWIDGMIDGLRELGYIEGQNLLIEWRLAAGKPELLPKMATELVESKVDLIVTPGDIVASIAKNLGSPIPILAVATHDGVGVGLYDSLAQPGQNITGLESLAPELDAKRIQFLNEIIPSLGRLAILYNLSDNGSRIHLSLIDSASKKLGIETHLFAISSLADFDQQFESISKWNPDALLTVLEPVIINQRKRIVEFCTEHRIPNAHEIRGEGRWLTFAWSVLLWDLAPQCLLH
jgi:putative ABC transport system substrate-binding protein